MTIEKIAIGTKRPGNRTKKTGAGVQGGRAFAFIEDDTWGGLNFLASDAFVGEEHPDKREVNLKDTADDDTPGVAPWGMGRNIRMAKPMEGVVARGALVGKGFENEQVFFPARAILVAHHRPDNPPINSTPINDSGDGRDDWVAGLHSLTRVRPWTDAWCKGATTTGDEPEPFSALLNFTKSAGDFTGWGGAHFAEGESVLSAEAFGVLRHGAPKHLLATTKAAQIRRSAIDIDRAIHGDGTDAWSAPVEYTRAAWQNGSRGPFVKRVERRMDFAAIHDHPCGPRSGMWKDMAWESFREYNPPPTVPPEDPPTDDPPPTAPPIIPTPSYVPAPHPRTTRPSTATPNEVESPSRYGHPIPDGPKSPSTGPTDWPGGGHSDGGPNYTLEHDSFWLARFGFDEVKFNKQPLTSHLIAGAVYEGTSAPWIPVKDQTEILHIRDGYLEDRERPAIGPGWETFAPANVQLHNLYQDQNPVFDETKLDYSMGVFAANGWDTRFGMGHRLPDSAFFARGFDIALDFSSDANNPDILITSRDETGAQGTGALKFNGAALGSGGVTDHGALSGLGDDDHTQYHNDARGDARYYQKTEFINTSAGAGDGGKPVVLDADGRIDATMINDGDIDHGALTGLADDDHALYAKGDPDSSSTTGNLASFLNTDGRSLEDSGIAKTNVALNSDNLSELTNAATARTNLGLGDRATQDDGDDLDADTVSATDAVLDRAATASITEASTPILDLNSALSGSNVRRRIFPVRASITGVINLATWAVASGENYRFRLKCLVKRTDSVNTSAWVDYGWVVEDIGGAITITPEANSSIDGVLAATAPVINATKGGTPILVRIGPTAGTEVWNGHIEVEGPLAS